MTNKLPRLFPVSTGLVAALAATALLIGFSTALNIGSHAYKTWVGDQLILGALVGLGILIAGVIFGHRRFASLPQHVVRWATVVGALVVVVGSLALVPYRMNPGSRLHDSAEHAMANVPGIKSITEDQPVSRKDQLVEIRGTSSVSADYLCNLYNGYIRKEENEIECRIRGQVGTQVVSLRFRGAPSDPAGLAEEPESIVEASVGALPPSSTQLVFEAGASMSTSTPSPYGGRQ